MGGVLDLGSRMRYSWLTTSEQNVLRHYGCRRFLMKLIRSLLFLDCTPRVFWAEVIHDR